VKGASVDIPAGALTTDVDVRLDVVTPDKSVLPDDTTLAGAALAFTPHGTTFAKAVTITLNHDGTATNVLRLDDEDDTTWEVVADAVIKESTVELSVTGFSIYGPAKMGTTTSTTCSTISGSWDAQLEYDEASASDTGQATVTGDPSDFGITFSGLAQTPPPFTGVSINSSDQIVGTFTTDSTYATDQSQSPYTCTGSGPYSQTMVLYFLIDSDPTPTEDVRLTLTRSVP